MSVLNNINSNSLYDVSILTDGNNNVQFTDPVESANILPPFTTTNANNILGVNTNGTQLEYKQNELLPTINGLVSGRILSNNGTNALWVLNPAPDLTQFHNLIDGSVSAPTLSQASDSTTGIYFNTQEVDVSIAGTKQLGITSTGINSSLMTSSNGYVHTGAPAFNNLSIKNGSTGTTGVFCRESTSNVGIICNGASAVNCLTSGTTITTQTTTPKIILTQTASNSDPQIQSNTDAAPKCGINISENNVSMITEGNVAATFANGQIDLYKPTVIRYEQNPWSVQANNITASNTTSKILKLNYTSNDVTLTLANTSDGQIIIIYPFKTSGSFFCYLAPSSNTISTYFSGAKTNYTSGTISIIEGYVYTCVFQSSISTWYISRSG
jgi:hypothetical protein